MQTQNSSPESGGMPMRWVDKIFDKLAMVYGHQFLGRWSGLDLEKVKADWAHELDGFERLPDSISHALKHLPTDNPPTVLQFRDLCRKAPAPAYRALPAPEVNQAVAQAALAKAHDAVRPYGDRLDPVLELRRRELEGDKRLTKFQREFWRIALKHEIERGGAQA